MIDPEHFIASASAALAVLSAAGILAVVIRWPEANRRDYLAAFGLVLLGMLSRDALVWVYGGRAWPDIAITLSALARCVEIVGSLLFVRAATKTRCGEVIWIGAAFVALMAALLR